MDYDIYFRWLNIYTNILTIIAKAPIACNRRRNKFGMKYLVTVWERITVETVEER